MKYCGIKYIFVRITILIIPNHFGINIYMSILQQESGISSIMQRLRPVHALTHTHTGVTSVLTSCCGMWNKSALVISLHILHIHNGVSGTQTAAQLLPAETPIDVRRKCYYLQTFPFSTGTQKRNCGGERQFLCTGFIHRENEYAFLKIPVAWL